VVGGTCQGYSKPSWQAGAGDNVRDIPDVSLFASNGIWGHYYVDCWSDIRNGGASCVGAPSTWDGGGGTSYSTPIFAGIQALVNQIHGAQGNPNYVYYQLAAGSGIFHSVTQGDNDVNCGGATACVGATQSTAAAGGRGPHRSFTSNVSYNGALSTSATSLAPAYKAGAGWNFATGLGSVDAYNLVTNWNSVK
jgi:subtilase family serine protease